MVSSKVSTVSEYFAELPPERRAAIAAVRKVIRGALPGGYAETMQYGMIGYVVPLTRYPAGYLGDGKTPLPYVALASQKNHMAVYLMNVCGDRATAAWFRARWKASGKKLDMGKSCLRFKRLEDLPLPLIGEVAGRTSVETTIEQYERARKRRK
ncbi:MAG: DUF1801 domain-containing protein [Dongiaceae bacterium]